MGMITETLTEFQESNCRGCLYADDEKVGTGRPCCTYPERIKLKDGTCQTRKEANDEP